MCKNFVQIHNSTKDKIWTPMGQKKVSFVSEVSSFQSMQEWYLGWACLEKCPQFMGVLIEREVLLYNVCVPLSSSWLAHKEDVVKEKEISIVRLDTLESQGGCEGVRV